MVGFAVRCVGTRPATVEVNRQICTSRSRLESALPNDTDLVIHCSSARVSRESFLVHLSDRSLMLPMAGPWYLGASA